MKFKTISSDDVKVLRAAKKVLKKLQKKEHNLNAAEHKDLIDEAADWKKNALEHWRMLDELDALSIEVDASSEILSLVSSKS